MTGQNLYDYAVSANAGYDVGGVTLFLQYVNIAKANRESLRPWRNLFAIDTSLTVGSSNTWKTPFNLPSDFLMESEDGVIYLFNDAANTIQRYVEVPYENRLSYKDVSNRYYIDHANRQFYLLGVVDDTYTIHFPYIKDTPDITAITSWTAFPARFHAMLANDALAMYKLGTDYDDINARNGNDNARVAELLCEAMKKYDEKLTLSTIKHIEYPEPIVPQGGFINRHIDTSRTD